MDTPGMAKCGRRWGDGKPCRNDVRSPGLACYLHGGPGAPASSSRRTAKPRATGPRRRTPASQSLSATWGPAWETAAPQVPASAPAPRRPASAPAASQSDLERRRVKEATYFCADSLSVGWQQAVADRAANYAQATFQRLFGVRRRRYCKALAQMAREILKAKDHIHELAGELAGDVAGVKGTPLAFTRELVANIPLKPIDAKMTSAARGIQVIGILLCVMTGRDVTRCQCFSALRQKGGPSVS